MDFSYQGVPRRLKTHTSASNLIVKSFTTPATTIREEETHWSPVPSKHSTNVRAACSGGTTMGVGPPAIEPSFTPPGLINADAGGELAVSVAVSEKLLPERKWPSSAVVDILSVSLWWEKKGGGWWALILTGLVIVSPSTI